MWRLLMGAATLGADRERGSGPPTQEPAPCGGCSWGSYPPREVESCQFTRQLPLMHRSILSSHGPAMVLSA